MIGAQIMTGDHRLPLGTVIAGHTIEQVLGQGGFGITYRVRNNSTGAPAALKEFFPSDDADRIYDTIVRAKPTRKDRFDMGYRAFLEEARTLNTLPTQRGLVRIQGAFEKHATVYALMDFIDGEPLDRAVKIVLSKRRSVPMGLVQDLIESFLGALRSIHQVGVLHRDIKPGNVMIRRDGQPVLIDFGAARPMSQSTNLASMFSRRYAALEQFPASRTGFIAPTEDGPTIDIFGFSILLYELVSQSLPPDAEERFKTFRTEGRDPYISVHDNLLRNRVHNSYPRVLLDVIDAGCALFPTNRLENAEVMVEKLASVIDPNKAVPVTLRRRVNSEPAAPAQAPPRPRPEMSGPLPTDIGVHPTPKRKRTFGSYVLILIIITLAAASVATGLLMP